MSRLYDQPYFFLTSFCIVFFSFSLFSQTKGNSEANSQNSSRNFYFNEQEFRERALADGVPAYKLDKFVAERKLFYQNLKNQPPVVVVKKDGTIIPFASCADMGGESSWGGWSGQKGTIDLLSGNITWGTASTPPPVSNGNYGFNLTSGNGIDNCTPSPGNPAIPVVAPGFGNSSIQLGVPEESGGYAERINFPLTVTAQDTNFVYAYAIVIEDGGTGHSTSEQPYVELCIYDANGNKIPCGCFRYIGGPNLPDFFPATCGTGIYYKPWTLVGVNLKNYIGQTLNVEITNADCAIGAHFAHSYWDFNCRTMNTTPGSYCVGSQISITAPIDPQIPYNYQWYQNGVPYTGTPSGTAQTITPYPQPGDTFIVNVSQPSGCGFKIVYVPQPISINAAFTSFGSCGKMNFTDQSTAAGGAGAITAWSWSFPGGNPSSSNSQNPGIITYPTSGTYTATLAIASSLGCTDTIVLPFTMANTQVANFMAPPVCINDTTTFTDLSTGLSAGATWSWDFGDGSSSTDQNPSHTYGNTGTFPVTLTIKDGACTSTVSIAAVVNPLPLANFSSLPVCLGDTTYFTDLSSISSGNITTWNWNFDDLPSGASNTSTLQNPYHVFTSITLHTVSLTVTSSNGCQSMTTQGVSIAAPPMAALIPQNVCLKTATQLTDASQAIAGDPINTWDWNFGDGTPHSNIQNPSHTYSIAGTYTLALIVTTANGCKDTTNNTLTIYPPPAANFSRPIKGCSPLTANYTDLSTSANGNINSWHWLFPGGNPSSSTIQNPSNISYTTAGSYSVSLSVTTVNGCKDSIILPMVEVYPWPTADFCVATSTAPTTNPVFSFCDLWSKDVAHWSWNFGDNSPIDSLSTDPTHSYASTATENDFYQYDICIRVENQHGCWDTTCHSVELIPEFTFYIPNTFTPNGDATNTVFYGKSRGVKEYKIMLFDRWGNLIWDCHREDKNTNWDSDITVPRQEGLSSTCKWDGVTIQGGADMSGNSGERAPEDVYVWKVSLLDVFDKRHSYVGHVNIVR